MKGKTDPRSKQNQNPWENTGEEVGREEAWGVNQKEHKAKGPKVCMSFEYLPETLVGICCLLLRARAV